MAEKRKYQMKVEYMVYFRTVGAADAVRKCSTSIPINAEHVKIQMLTSQRIDPTFQGATDEQESQTEELKREPALTGEAQTEQVSVKSEFELRADGAGYRQA
jgi:hypothetical protein